MSQQKMLVKLELWLFSLIHILRILLPHRGILLVKRRKCNLKVSPVGAILISYVMANTYSQISIHSVFAVKGRENLITRDWRDDLHRYISGIITAKGLNPWLSEDGKIMYTFFSACLLPPASLIL
jgi:hypothetical protein